MTDAVLAIEDRRYYQHPGVDPICMAGALFSYATGRRAVLAGASTITQQVIRNVFLPKFEGMTLQSARARSLRRKLLEQFLAIVLTSRASKDDILEMYLNEVPLGQRGSFAIFGVAEASRLFFAKDVSNVSLAEAATIAGVIQSPSALSPFNNPARAKERRNVVLGAMVDAGFVEKDAADAAALEPLAVVERALEAEAPHFVDFVDQTLDELYPGLTTTTNEAVDVYTTLDLHLQRLAQDAVRTGLTSVDKLLSRRKRKGRAEAALIAVDPKTGEVLAFVGGRSYNQSQYNRVISARRQPGSIFKPFVYLAAFEQAAAEGRTDMSPATIVQDEPETFEFDDQVWEPANYQDEYDGPITFRRALAHSRNLATIHVAQTGRIREHRRALEEDGRRDRAEALSVDCARRVRSDAVRDRHGLHDFPEHGDAPAAQSPAEDHPRRRRHHQVEEGQGTGAAAGHAAGHDVPGDQHDAQRDQRRAPAPACARAGFTLDAAGKTGTTNDLRDAWFVGFTPDLLTVVWVGFDDNQTVGLSGSQAALPIWADFMKRALAGRSSVRLQSARRHRVRRHRPGDRPAGHARLSPRRERGLSRRHAAGRVLHPPPVLNGDRPKLHHRGHGGKTEFTVNRTPLTCPSVHHRDLCGNAFVSLRLFI